MKIKDIYELAIRLGIQNDPRGEAVARNYLSKQEKAYGEMKDEEKKEEPVVKEKKPRAKKSVAP